VSWGPELLVAAIVLTAAMTALAFFHGRRVNRAIALRVSRELESALEPVDSTYTWIGGLIGFHARYGTDRGPREARATLTLLPRHAPAYMPIALLLGRGDRAHVTLYMREGFTGEAHIVSRAALLSPLLRIEGRDRMLRRWAAASGRRFLLLASDERLMDSAERLLGMAAESSLAPHLRHVALVPDLSTFHAQVVPRAGAVEGAVRLLLKDPRRLVCQ
jgi:hypothetical protein